MVGAEFRQTYEENSFARLVATGRFVGDVGWGEIAVHPDGELADWLSDRYPGEMTIVIQHWCDNLEVTDEGFSITLNFGENPEPMYIPYDAIKTFVDPSVEFGLRFEAQETEGNLYNE